MPVKKVRKTQIIAFGFDRIDSHNEWSPIEGEEYMIRHVGYSSHEPLDDGDAVVLPSDIFERPTRINSYEGGGHTMHTTAKTINWPNERKNSIVCSTRKAGRAFLLEH